MRGGKGALVVRLPTFEEEIAQIEPTASDKAALEKFDFNEFWRKCQASLPPSDRKQWKVADMWGNTILRFKTKEEAEASAIERNSRAETLGVKMRYRFSKDNGLD